jgi:hypothetical protein
VRRFLLIFPLLASCALPERDGVLSGSPSFRAKSIAVAATRGARGQGVAISRELVRRLEAKGLPASALEESDSVLAGSAVDLESARNPRLLDEIRRATDADAIVFLSLDPFWRTLDISALDARTGDAVLRSAARPKAEAFESPAEIAAAAASALATLTAERRAPKPSRPDDPPIDEIPLP